MRRRRAGVKSVSADDRIDHHQLTQTRAGRATVMSRTRLLMFERFINRAATVRERKFADFRLDRINQAIQ